MNQNGGIAGMDKVTEVLVELTEAEFDGVSFNGAPLLKTLKALKPEQVRSRETYDGYSVWAITLHLMYWKYFLAKQFGGPAGIDSFPYEEKDWPSVPEDGSEESWEGTLANLEAVHRTYIKALKAFPPERIDEELKEWRVSYGKACAWMATHDTYHVAQIRNMGLEGLQTEG
jgi:hypothetical protein